MPEFHEDLVLFSVEELIPIVRGGGLMETPQGGLIVGNSHDCGGINLIREHEEGKYALVAELEGWEYIMNPFATNKFYKEIKALNDEYVGVSNSFEEYDIPEDVNIIDARPLFPNVHLSGKWLLMGSMPQFVVNKFATKKYLQKLDQLNRETWEV